MLEKKYKRICPKCKDEVYHTDKYNRNAAEKQNKICTNCSSLNLKLPDSSLKRNCPSCTKELSYTTQRACHSAEKKGTTCKKCLCNGIFIYKCYCGKELIYKREADYKKAIKYKYNCDSCIKNNWVKNNPEKVKESDKKWLKIHGLEHERKKRKNDPGYRILGNLRSRIYDILKNYKKIDRTIELLGCSINEFKLHLEKQFDEKMNWDNYATYWEIDHIKPCAWFDFTLEEHQKECFHYTNTRPLDIKTNRGRGIKK